MSREADTVQLNATNPENRCFRVPVPEQHERSGRDSVLEESKGAPALARRAIIDGVSMLPWCAKCHALQRHGAQCNAYTIIITMAIGYTISARELTDYSFAGHVDGRRLTASAYLFRYTLPPILYLRDRFNRIILHFLTCVPRLGPVTTAVGMVAESLFARVTIVRGCVM